MSLGETQFTACHPPIRFSLCASARTFVTDKITLGSKGKYCTMHVLSESISTSILSSCNSCSAAFTTAPAQKSLPFLATQYSWSRSISCITKQFLPLLSDWKADYLKAGSTNPHCLFNLVSIYQASFQPWHYRCLIGPHWKSLNLAINMTEPLHKIYHWSMFHFIKH